MKKVFSLLISIMLVITAFSAVSASAAVYSEKEVPELFITEIGCDQADTGKIAKYPMRPGSDCFEFIEIVNLSGKKLNLYDYCITYNGNMSDSFNFENKITEITPIKAGDWHDGSTQAKPTDPQPRNPDTFIIQPGEVVVLWVMYFEALEYDMDVNDFRAHWNIPDDVRVLYFDGNGDIFHGGNDKNFNMKNGTTGTYGIAKISEVIEGSSTGYADVITWINVDYYKWNHVSIPNETFEFLLEKNSDNLKRALWVGKPTPYENSTVGTLNAKQIESFGDLLKAAVNPTDCCCNDFWQLFNFDGVCIRSLLEEQIEISKLYDISTYWQEIIEKILPDIFFYLVNILNSLS